ncbi:MAG: hypothetical protein E7A72_08220 [Actinomyces urogenitalis]|uniref:hypothetical protein n=1 Tax=Actinomyces urogenitalis TaxID=103621 RepID=UPI002431A8E0|nr:hypothetical protein [Actinomyces urogenitalis]MBS5977731.1 hypothetical protein [Actinomyces urogenitalis]MDU0972863.1 hypothetical protein [Actinomyces urogenitalis]
MSTHNDAEFLRTIADPDPDAPPFIMSRQASRLMTIAARLDALDEAPTPQPTARTGGSVLGAAIGYLLMAVAGSVIVSLGILALVEIWRAVL